jgi:hypothetical protein
MTLSFAAIPLPVLIGVPVVGLIAAIVIFEIVKSDKAKTAAAAAAAALSRVTAPPPPHPTSPGAVAAAAPVLSMRKNGVVTAL